MREAEALPQTLGIPRRALPSAPPPIKALTPMDRPWGVGVGLGWHRNGAGIHPFINAAACFFVAPLAPTGLSVAVVGFVLLKS